MASVPLSEAWPEPNYQQMIDDGSDARTVALIRALRDEVPNKPRKQWKVEGWAKNVRALRDAAVRVLDDPDFASRFNEGLDNHPVLSPIPLKAELYETVGHEKSLKGIKFGKVTYSMLNGERFEGGKTFYEVTRPAKKTAFSNMPMTLARGETKEEALESFKKAYKSLDSNVEKAGKTVRFDIYSRRSQQDKPFFIAKKIGRDVVPIKEGFTSAQEARDYLANNQAELESALEKLKEIPAHRKETNSPRVGIDHRNGGDVTPDQFSEAFGFRGVQFGNYVEQGRRQEDLNRAYDALMDLAGILNLPPRALSLNGEMGLAFGARGKGGKRAPAAHYEPGQIVINLTKREGAGSLAHEWFHGVDNYFSRMKGRKSEMMTEDSAVSNASRDGKFHDDGRVRPEMVRAFGQIKRAVNTSTLRARSEKLDRTRTKRYWSTGPEMAARSFESYIIEKLRGQDSSNDYLANIVSQEYWDAAASLGMEKEGTYPYPEAAEMPSIMAAFDNFFETVETRETDSGIALFRTGPMATPTRVSLQDAADTVSGITLDWSPEAVKRVRTVANFADLPAAVQDDVRKAGGSERTKGIFHTPSQTVYVIAQNHNSLTDIEETVFHEGYGHLGLAGLFDKEIRTKMNQLWLAIGGDKGIREAARRNRINLEGYFQDTAEGVREGKLSPEARNQVMMEELLSHLAQDQRPGVKKRVQELMGALRQWLRSHGFPLLGKLSDGELFVLLRRSKEAIKTNRFDKSFYVDSTPMFRTDHTKAAYEKRIDDLFSGGKANREGVRVLDSSDVLSLLGYADKPVHLAEGKVREGMEKHPNVTAEHWKKIPEWLDDPVAVFDSDTVEGRLVFVAPETIKGKPVVMIVQPNATTGSLDAHILVNAYDRGTEMPLERWIRDEKLRYINNEKIPAFNDTSGLRLPRVYRQKQGSAVKILTERNLVKHRESRGLLRQGDHPFTLSGANPSDTTDTGLEAQAILARNWNGNTEDSVTAAINEAKATAGRDVVDWLETNRGRVGGEAGVMFREAAKEGQEQQSRAIRSGVRDRLDAIRFQMQDKLIDLKRQQEGKTLEDDANPYQKAAIWEGKAGERINDFDEQKVQPLLDKVAKTGLSVSDVGEWLVARHAKEANAYLAEINPDKPADERYRLSGMSDEDAAAIQAKHADNAALLEVGQMVDAINSDRVDMLVQEGLITPEMAAQWRGRYKHYVPLKREEADGADYLPPRGQGFNIKGKESKQRTGSAYWTPSKILTNTFAQMESSIVRAEKNQVGRALLNFVEQNPDSGFWSIDTDRKTKVVRDGKVIEGIKLWDSPNELTVKRDGEEFVIVFNPNNDRAMRLVTGMKNLQAAQMGTVMRGLSHVTRFLSSINTSYNPEFLVSNFFRDIQTAAYNLSDTEISDMQGRVIKDVPGAMNGIRSALFGDGSAEWAETWEDFRQHGGKTGWIDIHKDLQQKERNLSKIVDRIREGKPSKTNWTRFVEAVEDMNTVVENGVRLSAYKNAIDAGLSKQKAAAMAKELTVNFNRKGNQGQVVNALYMFYNAAVQGNVRLMQAMANSKKGRRMAYATIGFAAFLDIINRSLAGDDDDGENLYDRLPDYVKNHNIIIMGEKEPLIKIPAPWGYNVLHTIGQSIGEAATGERFKALDSASRVGMSFIDAFNPVGSGTIAQVISPTVTDPIVQIAENKNFAGNPLKPEHTYDAKMPKPEYQMHFSTAREMSKDITEWLNNVSGGNEIRPGHINISPEWIDMIVDHTTGGMGRTAMNTVDTATRLITGEELETKNIPFVRKVTGFSNDYGVKARYYEWSLDVSYTKSELSRLRGPERVEALRSPQRRLIGPYTATEKRLRSLRNLRRMAEKQGNEARVERIDEQIRSVMSRFNRQYIDVMFQ